MSMKFKINLILVISSCLLALIILFTDNESLNSLFINYNDNLVINEVNVYSMSSNQTTSSTSDETASNTENSTTSDTTSSTATLLSNVASLDYWAWPTDSNYTITTYYSSSHKAIDIYSYTGYGSNIYAANNGVVTVVKSGCVVGDLTCNGKGGNYVIINHNNGNYYTVYMHLKDINVSVGDTVSRGQVIGTMGNTGNVLPVPTASSPYSGTHLHFCVYIGEPYNGGYAINPMTLY